MDYNVGSVHTGKVTGITKFGAFVTIAPGKSGLVHISEISNTYVSEVRDHLSEGQEVMVKVIDVDQSGRLNLSIKAVAAPAGEPQGKPYAKPPQSKPPQSKPPQAKQPAAESTFEDKLKRFMQDSDSKISSLKKHSEKRGSRNRGR